MRSSMTVTALLCFALLFPPRGLRAQQPGGRGGPVPAIADRTAGMQKIDGYFPLYWDDKTGNLWLEIPRFDSEFLLVSGLAAGLGSNDIGLDRGMEGGGKLVSFQRVGPKVLLVQANESFRSSSANPAERRSVEESFAKSILWGFTVAAETNGRVLVDCTDFVVRDGMNAANQLSAGGAAYRIDKTRSAVYLERTKAFPKNSEIEVTLTFAGRRGGRPGQGLAGAAVAADSASDSSPARSRASPPPPIPSPCASITRWWNSPTATTSRASTIRAPATSAPASWTTACPSANPW